MGADSPWHGAEEGSFGMLWVHGLQRSVVTLPDSGSKGVRFVAEHSAVQELVLTQLPTVLSQQSTCLWLPTSPGGLVISRKG